MFGCSKPILLEGSPGIGKTSLVEALALKLDQPVVRINLSDQVTRFRALLYVEVRTLALGYTGLHQT